MGLKDKVSDFQNNMLYKGAMAAKDADPGDLVSKSVAAVSKFSENAAVIMKGLDTAAIQHELTLRDNDKKVLALKTEMMNMMEVLLEYVLRPSSSHDMKRTVYNLRTMKDSEKVDPNGTTLEGRMQSIVKDAEQDVRNCSAPCEEYMKKKFVGKLFDGSRWEGRLAAFSDAFSTRRVKFSFALSVRTAQGVDKVQQTLIGIAANVSTGSGSAAMLLLFRQLESPKERELQKWIADNGGAEAVSRNEKVNRFRPLPLFKELQSKMTDIKGVMPVKGETTDTLMLATRTELRENIDSSLVRDRQQFNRKFDAVQEKLLEEIKVGTWDSFFPPHLTYLQNTMGRSTDRLNNALTELTGGPHDRIKDIDLPAVWKDMKYSKEDQEMSYAVGDAAQRISRPSSPALAVASAGTDGAPPSELVPRALEARTAQHELEDRWPAFDDDGSGWISVQEANAFTSSRPPNYSVVKWLAFWAPGRCELARAMVATSAELLTFNRVRVQKYMANPTLDIIDRIIHDVRADWDDYYDDNEDLMSHFTDHIESEKLRLTKELERFGWEIDEQNTLQHTRLTEFKLIAGTGRTVPIVDGQWAIERILESIAVFMESKNLDNQATQASDLAKRCISSFVERKGTSEEILPDGPQMTDIFNFAANPRPSA
ncbi:hypothetical protein DFH09DRAFT_1492505 [Mycena vulgaris]|nr:hypothetical protein DFH09DRAFT_1492505 [Mycena vulgaris]